MAKLDLTFVNLDDNSEMDAELEDNLTASQVIRALVREGFVPEITDPTRTYMLTIKGRSNIAEGQTLNAAGVQNSDTLRVSVTNRGGRE